MYYFRLLFFLAILPVVYLCNYATKRDSKPESPKTLLMFFKDGILISIPVIICELIFSAVFENTQTNDISTIFLQVLFGVALIEEGFKWIIVMINGYNNDEFDQSYDIIVYSIYTGLGFAAFENVEYVFTGGIITALSRMLTAVPGHFCFAIAVGYFLSIAKRNQINGNYIKETVNVILSIIVPIILHTIYDFLLEISAMEIWFVYIIILFVFSFLLLNKASRENINF